MNVLRTEPQRQDINNGMLRNESSNESLPTIVNLLLCILTICSSAMIPLLLSGSAATLVLSMIVCTLSTIIVIISSKKRFLSVVYVLVLVFLSFYFGTPILPAIIMGTVVTIGSASALLCAARGSEIIPYIISFPIAYAISLWVTLDPLFSLLSLTLLLPSFSMGLTARLGGSRTLSLALSSLSWGLLVGGAFASWVFTSYGSLSFDAFAKASEDMTGGIIYYTELAFKTINPEAMTNALRKEISYLAPMTINTLVGTVGCACIILSFFSHSVHMGLMRAYGIDRYLTQKSITVTVSFEAALVFAAAYLLTFLTDSSNNISFAATVSLNLCLILAPCLIHTGIGLLLALPQKLGILGMILWIVVLIFLFNIEESPLIMIALLGAFAVIITHIDSWAKKYYSKGDKL